MSYDELTRKINELIKQREAYILRTGRFDSHGKEIIEISDKPMSEKEKYRRLSAIYNEEPVYEV